jgi:endonuclease VIII-like 1
MPELAELKLTADFINSVSKGKTFINISKNPVHKGLALSKPFSLFTVSAISRGKELLLSLKDKNSSDEKLLLMTMGMSGHFFYSKITEEPKHAHLKFYTNDLTTLSFVDVRRFGKWKWVTGWSANRSPDPTTEFEKFKENILLNLEKKDLSSPIYLFLMNQKYCNGIGNYLRAEILYRLPNLDPNTPAKESFLAEPKLFDLCRDIPLQAYALGGGRLKDWENPFEDDATSFYTFMKCYGNSNMNRVRDKNGRMFWYDPKWTIKNP